jgi:hypothetical protein
MLIIETRSKPLRNWSRLMFWAFLLTGSFGLLLTMHYRPMPRDKK